MMTSTRWVEVMLKTAAEALSRGFHVFPCEPGAKTPLPNFAWSRFATNNVKTVVDMWSRWPNANVAVACKPSQLLVVDCDMPKKDWLLRGTPYEYLHDIFGPRVDGETLFDQVTQRYRGALGDLWTYRTRTTNGGAHYYYRWPPGVRASQASIVRGVLDVRGNGGTHGGYVLAAGSVTPGGPYLVENDAPVLSAPPWLIKLCTERPRPPVPARHYTAPSGVGRFAGIVEHVRAAPEGNRSNVLYWAARCLCTDGAQLGEALGLLRPAARHAGLTEHETDSTIRSAYRAQQRTTP